MSDKRPNAKTELAETTRLQAWAAEPWGSRWVSANAGTGKTHVLVQRVLRLLMAGAAADTILCLTYTNAAAAEMENRLFEHLSTWAVMSEEKLESTLSQLLGKRPDAATLRTARTLFATTLETPGGLKVQTIHAFCERLLRRFPLEAEIAPNSSLLDEAAAREVRKTAVDKVLRRAVKRPDSRLGRALTTVVALTTEDGFNDLVGQALAERGLIRDIIERNEDENDPLGDAVARLRTALGLRPQDDDATLRAATSGVLSDDEIEALYEPLNAAGGNARKTADALMQARHAPNAFERIGHLATAFLTKADRRAKSDGSLFAKSFAAADPAGAEQLKRARDAFVESWRRLRAVRVADASAAMLRLANEILQAYQDAKSRNAQLDFDDLIERTNWLLGNFSGGAAWVLYKLDSGLEHILVDEAQDTSPAQWDLISHLTAEFFTGRGSHENRPLPRTVFAVGDEKQSIYSFQGAQPKLFAEKREHMEQQARGIGHDLPFVPLTLSFRSTEAVLRAVDAVFADRERTKGITFGDNPVRHGAVRERQPGLVEIWELERAEPVAPAPPFDPLGDLAKPDDPKERLAERIARTIRGWLDDKTLLPSKGRPIEPGDILILVRKRHPFTQPMIRALKRFDIPVAGADRMRINQQIAIEDLMALGDFLLLPEDDLALAAVLKSPLFGLTDDDLLLIRRDPADPELVRHLETGEQRLRNISLWWALKKARDKQKSPAIVTAYDQLARWLMRADKVPPFELFAGILDINGGREKLTARLGSEAGDAINEFLAMALAFDEDQPPSLQQFLAGVRNTDSELKRDMEKGVNEVRLMTVHGAKGLEAEIVFLPDAANLRAAGRGGMVRCNAAADAPSNTPDNLIWALPGSRKELPLIDELGQTRGAAERAEYNRLLYVAMTRARDRLYVCGWLGARTKEPDPACWYSLIRDSLAGLCAETTSPDGRTVWRFEPPADLPKPVPAADETAPGAIPLPAWLDMPAAPETGAADMLSPSKLVPPELADSRHEQPPDEDDETGTAAHARDAAKSRGILIHALLERLPDLPPDARRAAAIRVVAGCGASLEDDERTDIVEETMRVLKDAQLAPLFGENGAAETEFIAAQPLAEGTDPLRLNGQIDRLVVTDNEVLIIDYKTNRDVPARPEDVPAAYVAQLAAYRLAMRPLYPGQPVNCALLWTRTPLLMRLPAAQLDAMEVLLPRLARS